MIYLTKGQPVLDKPTLVVCDQSGYYNDGDPVLCALASVPDEPACRFEAKYIAYGGMVYTIADPDALLEEIKKTDPATLYGKDSQQVAVDKAVSEIVPNESGVTDTPTPEAVLPDPAPIDTATSTDTGVPPIDVPPPSVDMGTSTPPTNPVVPDIAVSSTTPTSAVASTTPESLAPALDPGAALTP